jgi:hypothetical protein
MPMLGNGRRELGQGLWFLCGKSGSFYVSESDTGTGRPSLYPFPWVILQSMTRGIELHARSRVKLKNFLIIKLKLVAPAGNRGGLLPGCRV